MKSKKFNLSLSKKQPRVYNNVLLHSESPFAFKESYVKIRTSLMFSMTADKSRNCKSFVVTSSDPGDGKSVTSANIAISFAMLNKKTLLIDADLRKPVQKKLWGIDTKSGLCDFLANIGKCETKIVEGLPLTIVCTGTIPPNPSELLSSERMKQFLNNISGYFDYIIIDSPPINTVADAQIISTYVDGVVVVAKSGATTTESLKNAVDMVEKAGGNLCGTVLNNVDNKINKYSYRYKYSYKYGNGYYSDYYDTVSESDQMNSDGDVIVQM